MVSSGIPKFDESYGEFKKELCVVYGPAGSGKTTIALLACLGVAKDKQKCLFLDAENRFPIERFKQLAGKDYKTPLQQMFILNVGSFEEQDKKISELVSIAGKFRIIVLDSIGSHFRRAYAVDKHSAKRSLETQVRILNEISRVTPVLITNQVYAKEDGDMMIGNNNVSRWCPRIIRLMKDPRKIIQEKPFKKSSLFAIFNEGIKLD